MDVFGSVKTSSASIADDDGDDGDGDGGNDRGGGDGGHGGGALCLRVVTYSGHDDAIPSDRFGVTPPASLQDSWGCIGIECAEPHFKKTVICRVPSIPQL